MPAGLEIIRPDGAFQIDDDVKTATLAFRQTFSGPYTMEDMRPTIPEVQYSFDLSVPSNIYSLFFRSAVGRAIRLQSRVGNTWRFKTTTTGTIEVYGFADGILSPSTSGLQLFDESGVLTFDANSKFQRIVDLVRNASDGLRKSWPSTGRVYAAGIGSFPKRITGDYIPVPGIGIYYLWSYGVWVGPADYGVSEGRIYSDSTGTETPPSPSTPMQAPTLMAIDVTDF